MGDSNEPACKPSKQPTGQAVKQQIGHPEALQTTLASQMRSLSPSLSYSSLSLSPPPAPPLCARNIQEEGTADGKQGIRRELAGKPAIWLTRQAASEA